MEAQILQSTYDRMVQDLPRHELPAGSVWSLTDYIPNLDGAPLQKRGGWKAGPALSGAASLWAIASAPFGGDDLYCAIDNRSHIWKSPVGYAKKLLESSPSLYWRLGETVGAVTAKDSSGHNRTGTYGAGVTLGQAGALGGDSDTAAAFNDTGSARVSSNSYLPHAVAGASRTFMGLAYRLPGSADDDFLFWLQTGAFNPLGLKVSVGNQNVVLGTSSPVTWAAAWPGYNQWVHWVLTYNDSTRVAELFINGVSKGAQTLGSGLFGASASSFGIGVGTSSFAWSGNQDEFAVFESILPAATITGIYNEVSSPWIDEGAAVVPIQRPIFFNNLLIIPSDSGGITNVKKFNGTTISDLKNGAGSYGVSYFGLTYKSRLVLANKTTINFSNVLDPETWDVDSFVKTTNPITGLAALSNAIFIFSAGSCERLRGTIPPSSTSAGDMTLEPAFEEGCIDARSIVTYNDQVIWANLNGVHLSDGAAITNLIEQGGMSEFWHSTTAAYTSDWVFAGGIFKGRYVVSITDATGALIATLMCDLRKKAWTLLGNLPVRMFAKSQGAAAELVMALSTQNYVGYFSPCFDPEASASDGDGTAVQPSIEYPFFRAGTGSSRWRDLFLGVELTNGGAQTGELQFYYTTTPDDTTYTQLLDDAGNPVTIGGTSGYERHKLPVNLAVNGIGLKVVQVGASTKTALFDLEAVVHEREGRY